MCLLDFAVDAYFRNLILSLDPFIRSANDCFHCLIRMYELEDNFLFFSLQKLKTNN